MSACVRVATFLLLFALGACADLGTETPLSPAEQAARAGLANLRRGDLDKAIANLSEAVRLKPDYDAALLVRGVAYRKHHEIDAAIADFGRVIELKPSDSETLAWAYMDRGTIYLEDRKQYAQAVTDYDNALRINPDMRGAILSRAVALMELREYDRANVDFSHLVAMDARDANALHMRGAARMELGQFREAIADFDRTIKLAPDGPKTYAMRCLAYAADDTQLSAAMADCEEALRRQAGFAPALNARGLILLKQRRFDDARRDFDDALKQNREWADSLFGRALAEKALGADADAQRDLAEARRIRPDIDRRMRNWGLAFQ